MTSILTAAPGKPASPADASELAIRESAALAPTRANTRKSLVEFERSIGHYPEPIRIEVRWLQGFFLDHCDANVVTLRAILCRLGFDKSPEYYYNLLNGYYFASKTGTWKEAGRAWSEFIEIAAALRRYDERAARTGQMPFVQTGTYHCIADFITAKRALSAVCKVGGIMGATGGQKSESFKFYSTLNNHGLVTHLEAPANARLGNLQRKVAERYHATGYKLTYTATREQVIRDNVNETRCIIIDNVQRLYNPSHGADQECFNWLLELQDDTRCTLILSFTTDFYDKLTSGRAQGYFEQFVGRMGGMDSVLRLPDHAPVGDLRTIARAHGLPVEKPVMDYLHRWSRRDGRIRILFDRLQLARTFAQADGREQIELDDLHEADTYTPPAMRSEGGAA